MLLQIRRKYNRTGKNITIICRFSKDASVLSAFYSLADISRYIVVFCIQQLYYKVISVIIQLIILLKISTILLHKIKIFLFLLS